MNQLNQRIDWLDTLRAIGIFLVVLSHTGRYDASVMNFALCFYMPLFFFISGLFVKNKIREYFWIYYIKNRAQRLLIPYFVFCAISYLFWFLLGRNIYDHSTTPLQAFIQIFYSYGGDSSLIINVSLWFFTCMFVMQILFFGLIKILRSKLQLGLALLLLSTLGYGLAQVIPHHLGTPWGLHLALTAIVFYGIGYFCQSYILEDQLVKWNRWLVLITSLAAYLIFSTINQKVVFVVGAYGNYFYFYLSALGGILFWTHIARLLPTFPLISQIGKNTLIIFSAHLLIFPFITGFFVYVLGIPDESLDSGLFIALVYTVISILVLLPVAHFFNKRLPFLLGKSLRKPTI